MKNICTVHVQYCNKQSTPNEQVDALETERTEENHTTEKQNRTWTSTKTPFAVHLRKIYIHLRQQLKLYGKYTFIRLTISNKRLYEGAVDCASLCKLHYCMSLIRHWLSYYAIDFLLVLMINHCARLKVYLLSLIVQRCNCSSVDAIEC